MTSESRAEGVDDVTSLEPEVQTGDAEDEGQHWKTGNKNTDEDDDDGAGEG